jgi:hypothetical protein
MLFSVFYVGDSCQGWGREFESRFPLQIQKSPHRKMGVFYRFLNITQITNTNSNNQKYQMETSNQRGMSKNRASLVVRIHPNTIAVQ